MSLCIYIYIYNGVLEGYTEVGLDEGACVMLCEVWGVRGGRNVEGEGPGH